MAAASVQDASAVIASIEANHTEWEKYKLLSAKASWEVDNCDTGTFGNYMQKCQDLISGLNSASFSHLSQAVLDGDTAAAMALTEVMPGEPESLQPRNIISEVASSVIKRADSLFGQKSDQARAFLRLAGNITRDGVGVPVNYDRATTYYAAAWVAGDTVAAGLASNVYDHMHDLVNEYLWALRCAGACTGIVAPQELEQNLDGLTMKLVQSKATDPNVLGL